MLPSLVTARQWRWQSGTGVCPAWMVHTGCVVLPPVRVHALQSRTLRQTPHLLWSVLLSGHWQNSQTSGERYQVHPQMSGSVKHETVEHCSMRGRGIGMAAFPSCSMLSLQTLPWYRGLPAFRCQVYLLK